MSPIDTQQIGWTALMWASKEGHLPVAQLLIDKGAVINVQSKVCYLVLSVCTYTVGWHLRLCVSVCVLVYVHGSADSNI